MPKKKAAKPAATHISFRLKPAELEPLDADRKALPGVPVARNTYAKHVVLNYPGELRRAQARILELQKLESSLRRDAEDARAHGDSADPQSVYARDLLREAGL